MMSSIPSMMLVTATLAYALSPVFRLEEQAQTVTANHNIELFHRQAVSIALRDGLEHGDISGVLSGPFREVGPWGAKVVSESDRTVVITHLPDGRSSASPSEIEAFESVSPADLRGLPESYAGDYIYANSGPGGTIGRGDFSDMYLPIAGNSPAIITVINQEYAGAGSGAGNQ